MRHKTGIALFAVSMIIVTPLAASTFLASATTMVSVQPKGIVMQKTFAFGDVLEGTILKHAFIIANEGRAPLKIIDVRTSCGCTTVKLPEKISPNGQGQIVIRVDTSGRSGELFKRTIELRTNDPVQPHMRLYIDGVVHSFANLDRRYISLHGAIGKELATEATITPKKQYPFYIKAMELDQDLVGKIDVDVKNQNGVYSIQVRNILSQPGRYQGYIILKTDSNIKTEFTIFIRGFIYAM